MADSTQQPTLSGRQRAVFWAITLTLPLLLLLLLEGGLRLFGYGQTYPLFVPVEDFPEYLHQNRAVARRYFANLENVPGSVYDVFEAEKRPGTYRLFVQGGSSAAGYPYYFGGSFSRMLEQRLLQTFPEKNVEVINTAMAAVNSYTLLDLADEILAQQPDAVLIYAGHNEYYGALGVGSSQSLGQIRTLTNLYLALRDWRIVQLLRSLLARLAEAVGPDASSTSANATLMSQMVREQTIPLGDPLYEAGLRQFSGNLGDLLAKYAAAGVPVYIGTVASNERDHPPFIGDPTTTADTDAWRSTYETGLRLAAAGDTAAALEHLAAAITLDSLAADPFFAQGVLLLGQGEAAAARRAFLAAKDRDQLRFRAPEAMNTIIRARAAEQGATVVETQAALASRARHGIIGHEFMLEHLHPNIDGYFYIADAFYQALQADQRIGAWDQATSTETARRELLVTPIDSLIGEIRLKILMGSWPFQPPGTLTFSVDTLQAHSLEEQLALDLYRRQSNWYESVNRLRAAYEQRQQWHEALRTALAVIQEYPFIPEPYFAAGNILLQQRRYPEALAYYQAGNDRRESADALFIIGTLQVELGNTAAGVEALEASLLLKPNQPQALFNLSNAHARQGHFDAARRAAEQLQRRAPTYPGLADLQARLQANE